MKRLYRSRQNKVFAGVAGGMADYFGLDATVIRLLWLAVAFSWLGIPLYLLALNVIPLEPLTGPHQATEHEKAYQPPNTFAAQRTLGYALIGTGMYFLLKRLAPGIMDRLWPLLLLVVGAYFLAGDSAR